MGMELLISVWVCVCGYSPGLKPHLPFIACHGYLAAIDGNIQGKKVSNAVLSTCTVMQTAYFCLLPVGQAQGKRNARVECTSTTA